MEAQWFFNKESSPSDILVDKFADSKFGTDKWTSFAREVIQNSLDAQADDSIPVQIVFDLNKNLSLMDIPSGNIILDILKRCESRANNKQTKRAYKKGIEILSKEKVYCLKISDFNTIGVQTGRDNAWGALVFDEGVSLKQRPGSAGSHGVGKKVPFIISVCNTVFYATKNNYKDDNGKICSDSLMQGKTALLNWIDNEGNRRSSTGWYGLIDENASNSKNIVQPLINSELDGVPEYFKRTDVCGTDVIIVGVNLYDQEEQIKKCIINAILENFYIAFFRNSLEVEVFGERINQSTFESVYNKWYEPTDNSFNTLEDSISAYKNEPKVLDITNKDGDIIGNVKIHFTLGNTKNKKYYSIVRSHGMKIRECGLWSAEQPYTAVTITDGKELNALLADLENAAHDDFVIDDENMDIPEQSVYAYKQMQTAIKEYIVNETKIKEGESQEIEGLSSIISIPGTFANIKKKDSKPIVKKNPVHKKTKKGRAEDTYEEGVGIEGNGKQKTKKNGSGNKPATNGGVSNAVLIEKFVIAPAFIREDNSLKLKLQPVDDIKRGTIKILSINSEDKGDNSISDILDCAVYDHRRYKVIDGKIVGIDLPAGKISEIELELKRDIVYQMKAEVSYQEVFDNE